MRSRCRGCGSTNLSVRWGRTRCHNPECPNPWEPRCAYARRPTGTSLSDIMWARVAYIVDTGDGDLTEAMRDYRLAVLT